MDQPIALKLSRCRLDAQTAMVANQISGLEAGAELERTDAAYIAANGRVLPATNETGIDGFVPAHRLLGEPCTLYGVGTRFRGDAAFTPGQLLYLSAVPGKLSTEPASEGDLPVAKAINASDFRVIRDA